MSPPAILVAGAAYMLPRVVTVAAGTLLSPTMILVHAVILVPIQLARVSGQMGSHLLALPQRFLTILFVYLVSYLIYTANMIY